MPKNLIKYEIFYLIFLSLSKFFYPQLSQRSQDYTRSVSADRKKTWTGSGFVRVFEGASLEFIIDNIFKSGHYELVIRYEHMQTESWEDVRISIIRADGYPDMAGICADYDPSDDYKVTQLPGSN